MSTHILNYGHKSNINTNALFISYNIHFNITKAYCIRCDY